MSKEIKSYAIKSIVIQKVTGTTVFTEPKLLEMFKGMGMGEIKEVSDTSLKEFTNILREAAREECTAAETPDHVSVEVSDVSVEIKEI